MRISFSILLVFISSHYISQKGKISGYTFDTNNEIIPNVTIYFDSIEKIIYSNNEGFFSTPKLDFGNYTVHFHSFGYEKKIYTINIDSIHKKNQNIILKELSYELEEYEYLEEKEFNIRKLRAIEGVMITQGKKTEAIELEQLDGNKAVNLSRQIYSKIPGLNIWESDGAGIQLGLGEED